MSKNELEEAKRLFKEITLGLTEIKTMLNELLEISKKKEELERLQRRRTRYIQ